MSSQAPESPNQKDTDPKSPDPKSPGDQLNTLFTIPNQITMARLGLALIFFGILIADNYNAFGDAFGEGRHSSARRWGLNIAFVLFILAAVSDFFDGYLARKWNMVSTFGRIADPIADKVFICGAFVLLIHTSPYVHAWFAVLLITREFIVSGLRGYMESTGIEFGADSGGKLKMIFQSIAAPTALCTEANLWDIAFFNWASIFFLVATAILTVSSCISYILKAIKLLKAQPAGAKKLSDD